MAVRQPASDPELSTTDEELAKPAQSRFLSFAWLTNSKSRIDKLLHTIGFTPGGADLPVARLIQALAMRIGAWARSCCRTLTCCMLDEPHRTTWMWKPSSGLKVTWWSGMWPWWSSATTAPFSIRVCNQIVATGDGIARKPMLGN